MKEKLLCNPLMSTALENTEVLVDNLFSNELLKSIPIVSTAIGLCKTALDIHNKIFIAKIKKFLNALDSISFEAKEKIKTKMRENPKEANKVGETILLIFDQLNDLEKSDLVAVLFLSYVYEHIDISNFRRLCDAINQLYIDDVRDLLKVKDLSIESDAPYMQYLMRSGLTQVEAGQTWDDAGKIFYQISTLGQIFIESFKNGKKHIS